MSKYFISTTSSLICLMCLTHLAVQAWDGLTFQSFYDEATHILGGKMLDSGAILYKSFIDGHGPLIFLVAQVYGLIAGWSNPNTARLMNLVLLGCTILSIAVSPVVTTRIGRVWAVAIFAVLLSMVWLRQGLYMMSFYPLGGALAGIALNGFVLPVPDDRDRSTVHAFAAGFALPTLGMVAYSFLPTIILFSLAVVMNSRTAKSWKPVRYFALGGVTGIILNALYLVRFVDLRGYLAFHFAENQFIYARYVHFSLATFLHSLIPSLDSPGRIQTLAVCCILEGLIAYTVVCLVQKNVSVLLSIAITLVGVLILNARGSIGFQDGAFVYMAVLVAALSTALLLETLPGSFANVGLITTVILLAGIARFVKSAQFTPFNVDARTIDATPRWPIGAPSDGLFFQHIRQFAKPTERILALAYQPNLYLLADRLPVDGFYAYFPWDADYAKAPWFHQSHDLCSMLMQTPPPVIVFNDDPFWGYKPLSYIPCLHQILKDTYVEDKRVKDVHGRLYVRRDRARID